MWSTWSARFPGISLPRSASSPRAAAEANARAVPSIHSGGDAVRRWTNAFVAGCLLLLFAPLLLAIAAGICIETGRPVFFLQTRLGRGGRPFRLIKFRKFRQNNNVAQLPLTLYNDSRLTRVGRLLERSKLDELPQLWNVVRGEMAIVGPRPESLTFQDCFAGAYRFVLQHTPGIFGPSQALFRNEGKLYRPGWEPEAFYRAVLFPAKAQLDLAYYPGRTPIRDLIWVFHGVLAVLGCAPISRHVAMMAHETTDFIRRVGGLDGADRALIGKEHRSVAGTSGTRAR